MAVCGRLDVTPVNGWKNDKNISFVCNWKCYHNSIAGGSGICIHKYGKTKKKV